MDSFTALAILTLSDADFASFVNSYDHQEPDAVAMTLAKLSPAQRLQLSQFEQLGIDIHTHACQGTASENLRWSAPSGWWSCSELIDNHARARQWGADSLLKKYADNQRELLFAAMDVTPEDASCPHCVLGEE